MNTAIAITIGLVGIVGINIWANEHTKELMASARLYEQCVITEYGMTPLKYYEEQKLYPTCGN